MTLILNGTTGITSPGGDVSVSQALSGNLTFTGTGNRITGDFSNATIANRVLLQSSTSNGQTSVGLIPNGTSTQTQLIAFNSTDPANSSYIQTLVSATEARINSGQLGTGTNLPMTFYTGGSERLRLTTDGNLGLGVTPSAWNSAWRAMQIGSRSAITSGAGTVTDVQYNVYRDASNNDVYIANDFATRYRQISGGHYWSSAPSGTAGATVAFGDAEMALDPSGNLLVGRTSQGYTSKLAVNGGIETYATQFNMVGNSGATFEWVLRTGSTQSFYVNNAAVVATLSTTGVWTNASDARYKENIVESGYGLSTVMALKPRAYNLIGQADKPQIGFIAQEVLDVLPEVVDSTYNSITEEDRYTLSYGQISAVLVKAIQELKAEVDALKGAA